MIVVTADVGGTKTVVRISEGDREIARGTGSGAAVRPGRALVTAASTADIIRQTMATSGIVRAGTVVAGVAGAGSQADADEIRLALVHDQIADRVIVTTDVMLALEALGSPVGAVLLAGTGSIALGRTRAGEIVRQGGLGWRMGDDGSGYWIGQEALRAVGAAHDGRGGATALVAALTAAARVDSVRALAAWATVAEPREVAGLTPHVARAAEAGDAVAAAILEAAAGKLADLVQALRPRFEGSSKVPLGLTGGLLPALRESIQKKLGRVTPFVVKAEPIDPVLGGPRLAGASADGGNPPAASN